MILTVFKKSNNKTFTFQSNNKQILYSCDKFKYSIGSAI